MTDDVRTRFDLQPDDIPSAWFNIMPAIAQTGSQPLPPLHPGTKEPVTPDLLAPLFPEALIMQEVSTDEWIDIPGEVIDIYRLWRPTPLFRATRLEQALQTPARIYFKYEGVRRRVRTSRTPRCRRRSTTSRPAPEGSRPRPARGSGGPRSRSRASSSGSNAPSTW